MLSTSAMRTFSRPHSHKTLSDQTTSLSFSLSLLDLLSRYPLSLAPLSIYFQRQALGSHEEPSPSVLPLPAPKLVRIYSIFVNMKVILIICSAIVTCAFSQAHVHQEWNNFKLEHGKSYSSEEEETMRLGIYLKNQEMIDEHNKKYEQGLVTFKMAMNHFGDMTDEEFASMVLSPGANLEDLAGGEVHNVTGESLSGMEYFNWYDRGAVTEVKNQGKCGSCWAFSVTGALEGHMKIKYGTLTSLSEQNLLDCSSYGRYNNYGCQGGWMPEAFKYVIDNMGVDTEVSYPYEGALGRCRFNRATVGASCTGFVKVPQNEMALKNAVERAGPVSVAMDGLRPTFRFYSQGIYFDPACGRGANALNHGVLAVGFGRGIFNSYWIVKNSWGPRWGERGFFKLARNMMNHCGIASAAVYPIV